MWRADPCFRTTKFRDDRDVLQQPAHPPPADAIMAAGSGLKAKKPSKVVKPKKSNRRLTQTTRNHRFQSFSERVAKLKIDPIRRRRPVDGREELTEGNETHLGSSLQTWQDLNLSQTFTAFSRAASPLSDSLPVVLHNEDEIFGLLVEYIEKADALAMEPLLDLLSHFAHDLDTRFEKHFQQAVAIVTSVAAKHPDPAVIEWSFTCLAWLFKYLSRLLAPDLRPLYNLMSPYLGKTAQKPFIIRFAAESMSFLLRKAAATYDRSPEALDCIVEHILADCVDANGANPSSLHRQGVMTLLTEAMIGVQHGLHSSAEAVLRSLLKVLSNRSNDHNQEMISLAQGCLTSVLHHTTADTFRPLLDVILEAVKSGDDNLCDVLRCSKLLFTTISVRKGSRITDWKPVVKAVESLMSQASKTGDVDGGTAHAIMSTLAVALQYASFSAVSPALSLVEAAHSEPWSSYFLQFCDLCARLDQERFQTFVMPSLSKFVIEQSKGNESAICLLLARLRTTLSALKLPTSGHLFSFVLKTLSVTLDQVDRLEVQNLAQTNVALAVLPYLTFSKEQQDQISLKLLHVVQNALPANTATKDITSFALGPVLLRLLELRTDDNAVSSFWPQLCSASRELMTLPCFWTNILRCLRHASSLDLEGAPMEILHDSIVHSLASPSHTIRQTALEVLQILRGTAVPQVLSTAVAIEFTPVSLETSRAISMSIRRLAPEYTAAAESDSHIRRAIPTFCFGLLHLRLAQAWEDVGAVLAEMCKDTAAEQVVMNLAQQWLEGVPAEDDEQTQTVFDIDSQFKVLSDFECPNAAKLTAIADEVFTSSSGYPSMEKQLMIDVKHVRLITSNSRSQAIRVLHKIVHIAEKRSRVLVPVLLQWAGGSPVQDDEGRWNRKDQKAMLALFAQFTNPKVLFKSTEVYDALLTLCANGDVEIQRSALKAILAWKQAELVRYQGHLFNLLDEDRFREELAVFLQNGSDEDAIAEADHPVLMPVLLRLLYGRAVAGKHEQESRRKAIFVALSRFDPAVLGMFVDIAVPKTGSRKKNGEADADKANNVQPLRQQLGMLNMIHDLLETLGSALEPFASGKHSRDFRFLVDLRCEG